MKKILLIFLSVITLNVTGQNFAKIPSYVDTINLCVLIGQSNGEGRLDLADLLADVNFTWTVHDSVIPNTFIYCPSWNSTSRIEIYDPQTFQPYILGFNQINGQDIYAGNCGLDMYLTKLYADTIQQPMFLLKLALSGWPLGALTSSFNNKGVRYVSKISDIARTYNKPFKVKYVIMWQGEYEAQASTSEAIYKGLLDDMVTMLEQKLNPNIIFIDVNLSDNQTGVTAGGITNVKAAKAAKAAESSRYYLINTDDITDYPDNIHAGKTGLRTVAERILQIKKTYED